jgi:hypothetical protein
MRQTRTLWICAALIAALAVGLGVRRRVTGHDTGTPPRTAESVRKQLEQAIPLGSSRSAVESYLDSRSIPHSYIDASKFPNERRLELAPVQLSSQSRLIRGDIQIRIRLDESGRLLDYSTQEIFTGP